MHIPPIATQVPETWGTSPYVQNSMIRTGNLKSFYPENIQACQAACKAREGCKYFSWYQYLLLKRGRCLLSTASQKPRKAGGWTTLPVVLATPAPPVGEYTVHKVAESLGQPLVLCSDKKKTKNCDKSTVATNPLIHFSTPDKDVTQVYSALVGSNVLTPILKDRDSVKKPKTSVPEVFIMKSPRKDCQKNLFKAGSSFVGFATSNTDRTLQFYKHDPRLRLLDNTLDSPADISADRDTGVFGHSASEAQCPLAIPNFLNEQKCVRHTEGTCSPLEFITDKKVKLDRTNLRLWYTTSHKHVLAVDGLQSAESSPCTPRLRSRWRLLSGKCKGGPSLDAATKKTLTKALRKQNTMCDTAFSRLPEDERSYSSVWGNAPPGLGNARSRIDSNSAWMAGKKEPGEWLQFDFGEVRQVVGAVVQPRKGKSGHYVKSYEVERSVNGKDWFEVPGEYFGSKTAAKTSYFPAPVSAQYVRLVVNEWNGHIAMRADVLLCRHGNAPNPDIRDVIVSDMNDGTCSKAKSTIGAKIQVTTDTCWQHVHSDTLNVYEFSGASVDDCPSFEGAPQRNKINVAAETGSHVLQYTDSAAKWKTLKNLGVWVNGKRVMKIKYVGRFGDIMPFEDFDPDLQTLPMANALGVKSTKSTVGVDACGSRAEVANNPLLGNMFYFRDDRCFQVATKRVRRYLDIEHVLRRGKAMVFTNLALKASDQLRQRVAWALSQIFVISEAVC